MKDEGKHDVSYNFPGIPIYRNSREVRQKKTKRIKSKRFRPVSILFTFRFPDPIPVLFVLHFPWLSFHFGRQVCFSLTIRIRQCRGSSFPRSFRTRTLISRFNIYIINTKHSCFWHANANIVLASAPLIVVGVFCCFLFYLYACNADRSGVRCKWARSRVVGNIHCDRVFVLKFVHLMVSACMWSKSPHKTNAK